MRFSRPAAVTAAQDAGKKVIIEEWGSLYGSGRDANITNTVQKINNYGVRLSLSPFSPLSRSLTRTFQVPWFYCELITNVDDHQGTQDYEIEVNGADWSNLVSGVQSTSATKAAFDFSGALAL